MLSPGVTPKRFVVTLEEVLPYMGAPARARIRTAMTFLVKWYGLKCVSVEEQLEQSPGGPTVESARAQNAAAEIKLLAERVRRRTVGKNGAARP